MSSAEPTYNDDLSFYGVARMFIISSLAALAALTHFVFHNDDPAFYSGIVFYGALACLVILLVERDTSWTHRAKVLICLMLMGGSGLVHFLYW